jgi:hypothetical protein
MGGIAALNLRQGFSTYLQTRDFERLDAFVKLLSTHLQQSDQQRLLDERPIDMPALLQQLATQDGVIARIPAKDDVGRPSFRPESGPPARGRCAGRHREAIPINLVRGCRCFISMDNRGAAAPRLSIEMKHRHPRTKLIGIASRWRPAHRPRAGGPDSGRKLGRPTSSLAGIRAMTPSCVASCCNKAGMSIGRSSSNRCWSDCCK